MLKKRKKTIKISLLAFLIILSVLILSILGINKNLAAGKIILTNESLIVKQKKIDNQLNCHGFTIDNPNIIINPYKIAPLTALIMFETKEEIAPKIIINGKNNSQDFVHQFQKNTKHYLPIYGLYPDTINKVSLQMENKIYDFKIKTDALPKDFAKPLEKPYFNLDKKHLIDDYLYFVTPSSQGYTCAYDLDGEVRWYLTENLAWEISRLENGRLLLSSERLINPPYYTTGLYEISMLGKIYNEFVLPGGYHHDFFEKDNGNLIIATNDFKSGTVEDYIVELDRKSGEILKEIDLKEILPKHDGKSENWSEYDWFHNNSVWYDKKTNSLTLSGRHQDIVLNIDYDNLDINYIIGDHENFSREILKFFLKPQGFLEWPYSQHAAKITPSGNVLIFDNGNNRAKNKEEYLEAQNNYSRAVLYQVNKENMTIKQVFQYGKDRGSEYYSSYISDVDYLEKDHYLVHSGGVAYKDGKILNQPPGLKKADQLRSYTTEIFDNIKIFELILPNNNYRAEKMKIYANKEIFEKKPANYLGSLGKTDIDRSKKGFLYKTNDDQTIFDNYNIKIFKESDRLTVSGEFKTGDQVSILLYNNFLIKEYDLMISRRPYTAMCIDIFNEDEKLTVDKYINDEGLNGKYAIFIKINHKIYKTNQIVNFDK